MVNSYDGYKHEMGFDNEYEGRLYTLDIRNRTEVALENLSIECRFFYTVEKRWRTLKSKTVEKLEYEQCSLSSDVDAGEKLQLQTEPFIINSWELQSGVFKMNGDPEVVESSEEGLWVKVSYTTPDGDTITRDFCDPSSLSSRVNWEEKTASAD